MSALDLLKTIGRARLGKRLMVCEAVTVSHDKLGTQVTLPMGTELEVRYGGGCYVDVMVAIDGKLFATIIWADQFHCLDLKP